MGFVTPAWLIQGDMIIEEYFEGKKPLEDAEKELKDLGVPDSMIQRLYKQG